MRAKRDRVEEPPAIGRRFGPYKSEPESLSKPSRARSGPALSRMREAYEETCRIFSGFGFDDDREIEDGSTAVSLCYHSLYPASYTARDIEIFALSLSQGWTSELRIAGIFLSALARMRGLQKVRLHLEGSGKLLDGLGTANRGILEVHGDAGSLLGEGMEDGVIALRGDAGPMAGFRMRMGVLDINGSSGADTAEAMDGGFLRVRKNAGPFLACEMKRGLVLVDGNAAAKAGMGLLGGTLMIRGDAADRLGQEMEGGLVIVRGNAGDGIGTGMKGGRIIVFGNAGKGIGNGMEGGVIEVYGEMGSISRKFGGGVIYHKGLVMRAR